MRDGRIYYLCRKAGPGIKTNHLSPVFVIGERATCYCGFRGRCTTEEWCDVDDKSTRTCARCVRMAWLEHEEGGGNDHV